MTRTGRFRRCHGLLVHFTTLYGVGSKAIDHSKCRLHSNTFLGAAFLECGPCCPCCPHRTVPFLVPTTSAIHRPVCRHTHILCLPYYLPALSHLRPSRSRTNPLTPKDPSTIHRPLWLHPRTDCLAHLPTIPPTAPNPQDFVCLRHPHFLAIRLCFSIYPLFKHPAARSIHLA
jgi:hypothetical protein